MSRTGLIPTILTALLLTGLALPGVASETLEKTCDDLAASPFDLGTVGTGVSFDDLDAPAAILACEAAVAAKPTDARLLFQLGRAYDASGEADKAVAHYERSGTPIALYSLGTLYEAGYGVEVDPAKAFDYHSRAAEAPLGIAREALGRMYEKGFGTRVDYAKAAKLYEEAIKLGFAPANGALGYLYENGWGVEKDGKRALELYRLAADAGEAFAIHNIAIYHADGLGGLEANSSRAIDFYEKAAALGWEPSKFNLALAYSGGVGVEKDRAKAEAILRELIELDGEMRAEAQNSLAWMFAVNAERLDEAEELARAAVASSPQEANYLDTLAWVLHHAGRQEEALVQAERAVSINPKQAYRDHLEAIRSAH